MVIGKSQLEQCFTNNPFLTDKDVDLKKLYVAFLSSVLPENSITQLNLNFIKPDALALDNDKIYIKYDSSPAKTKLNNNWIEKSYQ